MKKRVLFLSLCLVLFLFGTMTGEYHNPDLNRDAVQGETTSLSISEEPQGTTFDLEDRGFFSSENDLWKRYDKGGTTTYNTTSKVYGYSTSVGMTNAWNGTDYLPYIWNPVERTVKIGNATISHNPDGALTIEGDSGILIGRLSWYAQYYLNSIWNNVTLDNYSWLGFTFNEYNITARQRFWGSLGELNVTITYRNMNELKITVDVTNWAAQNVPIRVFWVAAQLENVAGNYDLILDNDGTAIGVNIGNFSITWKDVTETTPDIFINTLLDKPNRRAAIQFGNVSNIVNAGATWNIDPSVSPNVESDLWDDGWTRIGASWYHRIGYTDNRIHAGSEPDYSQMGFNIVIPKDATIVSAELRAYSKGGGGTQTVTVSRLVDTTENLGPLEQDTSASRPSTDGTPTDAESYTTTAGWRTHDTNIDGMLQEQVNKAGWISGYNMGFRAAGSTTTTAYWEDYSNVLDNEGELDATYLVNSVPVVDSIPTLDNPTDTTHMYAHYTEYEITVYVSDGDGYADIDFLEIGLWNDARNSERVLMRYDEDTNVFSIINDYGYVTLNTGSSSAIESGNDIDATFVITIDWDFPDDTLDLRAYVIDDEPESDTEWYESTIEVETDLDYSTTPFLSDSSYQVDRGDYDTLDGITASGTIKYYGGTVNPPSDEVDVWVSCGDVAGSPWSDLSLTSGAFSMTVDSDDIIGLDTYTFKVVIESAGSGGSDLYYTTSFTDTYIADRIQVQSMSKDSSGRINITDTEYFHLTLWYDYDDTIVDNAIVSLLGGNNPDATYSGSDGIWDFDDVSSTTGQYTYAIVSAFDFDYGINVVDENGKSVSQIWDELEIWLDVNFVWTIAGYNVTLSIAYIDSDYNEGPPYLEIESITWVEQYPVSATVAQIVYSHTSISTIKDSTHGLTHFKTGSFGSVTVTFDNITVTTEPNRYWVQYSPDLVWLIWGSPHSFENEYDDSPVMDGIVIQSVVNGTDNARSSTDGGSIYGLSVGAFDIGWYYIDIKVYAQLTIGPDDIDILLWEAILSVDILHSLQIVTFSIVPSGDYFWIIFQTSLLNASITVWDDAQDSGTQFADNIYHSVFEGMHDVSRGTTVGIHNYTICITTTGTEYDRDYTVDDYTWWYNFTHEVKEPPAYDSHIVILNNLYELIPFDTFEVYKNDTRIYHDIIQVVNGYVYNITIKNRFGDTVNSTVFDADFEMVIFVNTFSFKFMNWYNGFLRVNVTRAGVTYSEIIMPTEIIEFNLFEETYVFSVDFLNGTTKFSQEITVTNSTGYVITGDSISDVFGLLETTYAMTTAINVTVQSTNNYALTISIDLTNINTTINEQLIQVLLNITNTNSTIFDQTVDLLAYMQNVNSTLYNQAATFIVAVYNNQTTIYDQTVSILTTLTIIGSNVTANFINLSADLLVIDSNLYANFTSLSATLLAMDSSLLSNFTSISASLLLINSTLVSNFTAVTAKLTAIGSNITSNYLSLAATLLAMDSSLLSNFTSISASLVLIDSNLLSNFTEVTATLFAIGSNITSNHLFVTSTLTTIGSNITSNYLSITATLSLIDSNLLSNFTNIVAQMLSVNSSIAGQFITIITDIGELNATMYLIDDPTHLNPLVLGSKLSDDYCDFTIVTTWHNSTISIHDNDVLRTGPTSELLSPIRYPLMDTSGTHNLSVFIDGGADSFWYNISYTIATQETPTGDLAISYRATNGKPISFLQVNSTVTYNGNTIILSDNVLYSVPTNANFTLEVRNIWGALIHNSTFTYASHKWIMLNMVEFVLDNQADHMVRVDLSYNGTYANITYMVPAHNPRILDVYEGEYLVTFTYYSLSIGAGELVDYYLTTGYYVSYTINITGPGGLMYSGIGLLDIQNNINANTDEEAETTRDFVVDVKNNLPSTPKPFVSWDTMILALFVFAIVLFIVWGLRAVFRDRREGKVAQVAQLDPLEEPIQYE